MQERGPMEEGQSFPQQKSEGKGRETSAVSLMVI